MARKRTVLVRRIYDEPKSTDGNRVLVDRLWPRGMTKAKAKLDEWCKDAAPSPELRKWYGHDPARFHEFERRYVAELHDSGHSKALGHLKEVAEAGTLTLLTATKDPDFSAAAVLAKCLE